MKNTHQQLTRDEFREQTFARDNYKCVVCGEPAVDAHHIIERRLWGDSGGYFIANGASVCEEHHLQCEMTTISVEQIRSFAGITKPIIPQHMYSDVVYDKWGNVLLEDGRRLRGELFYDESVQKILARGKVLDDFVKYVKYPRTYHLPWSPGLTEDDRMMPNMDAMHGQVVIVTEKLDGENTTAYPDYIHARSVTSGNHVSRDWIKAWHAQRAAEIPDGWRLNLENMYAEHSISYTNLDSYAYLYSIWDCQNRILPWNETLIWCELLGINPCPTIYWGIFDEKAIQRAFAEYKKTLDRESEGYVVRVDKAFNFGDFRTNVGKYVRENHVQTVKHWMHGRAVTPNKLRPGVTGFEHWTRKNNNNVRNGQII